MASGYFAALAITIFTETHVAMKACVICGETKPLSDFYKHPNMADGRLNKCKKCHIARNKDNQAAYRHSDSYAARKGEWIATRVNKDRLEQEARQALYNAIRRGEIKKAPACWYCGSTDRIEGHHADYARPLDVIWLCRKCHARVHRETRTYLETLNGNAEKV